MIFSQYLTYALVIVVIFTLYMTIVGVLRKDKNSLRAKKIDKEHNPEEQSGESDSVPQFLENFLIFIGIDFKKQAEIHSKLLQAGIGSKSAVVYFLFFQRVVQPVLIVIGGGMIFNLIFLQNKSIMDDYKTSFFAFLFLVFGFFGTKLFLDNSKAKRKAILVKTFPEALDLMLICVESGLGIDAAFGRVCKEIKHSHPIIGEEFERTRFEMTMMSDRVQALQNLSDRTGVPAIRALVSALVQAERFGTSLVDTMRVIASEQRTERMLRAEAKAARLPALITIPLIFFIMPALFVIILTPAVMKFSGGIIPN